MVPIPITIITIAAIGLYLSHDIAITKIHNQNHNQKETIPKPAHTIHPNIGSTELNVDTIFSIILNQAIISKTPNILNTHVIIILDFFASDIICSADTFPLDTIEITFPAFA
jgi:hypothetical protein